MQMMGDETCLYLHIQNRLFLNRCISITKVTHNGELVDTASIW